MAVSEAESQDAKSDGSERRCYPRDTVVYAGRLSFGAHEFPCTVLNISAGGAQLRLAQQVQAWTIATLQIDRFGKFHGRIVWQRGETIGLQFLEDPVLVTKRIIAAGIA